MIEKPTYAHFNWWSEAEAEAKRIQAGDPTMDELIERAEACDAALQALHDPETELRQTWGTHYFNMLQADPRTAT
jgi:hypothetical protein